VQGSACQQQSLMFGCLCSTPHTGVLLAKHAVMKAWARHTLHKTSRSRREGRQGCGSRRAGLSDCRAQWQRRYVNRGWVAVLALVGFGLGFGLLTRKYKGSQDTRLNVSCSKMQYALKAWGSWRCEHDRC
jgi:hypothetical protein